MGSVCNRGYFLSPRRGRHSDVDLRESLLRYELFADLFYEKPQRLFTYLPVKHAFSEVFNHNPA